MGRAARGVKAMTLGARRYRRRDGRSRRRAPRGAAGNLARLRQAHADCEYRHTSRGGKGVKAFARQRDDIGQVVDQILVAPEDQILMITSGNQVIRLKVGDIRKTGRDAKGVRLQRLGAATRSSRSRTSENRPSRSPRSPGEPQQAEL